MKGPAKLINKEMRQNSLLKVSQSRRLPVSSVPSPKFAVKNPVPVFPILIVILISTALSRLFRCFPCAVIGVIRGAKIRP